MEKKQICHKQKDKTCKTLLAQEKIQRKGDILRDTKIVLFDLDGTLVDSCPDIADCVNAALKHFDFPILLESQIKTFVGNGSKLLIQRSLLASCAKLFSSPFVIQNATQNILPQGLENAVHCWYLDYYSKHPVQKTKLYSGVASLLLSLKKKNIRMGIVSNKPSCIVKDVIESFCLSSFFDAVVAQEDVGKLKPDKEGIMKAVVKICAKMANKEFSFPKALGYDLCVQQALLLCATDKMVSCIPEVSCKIDFPIVPQEQVLMIGDGKTDILAGKNYGSKTCAVLQGYGNKQELLHAMPNYVLEQIEDLC